MNILLLYPYYNQRNLIHNFSDRLKERGVNIDSICIDNMEYEKNSHVQWSCSLLFILSILGNGKTTGVLHYVLKVVYHYFIPLLFPKYDAIDFHAYYPQYNKLMEVCVKKDIKFLITLWGSDLMRANDNRKKILRYGFEHCVGIKLSDNLFEVLSASYSGVYDDKCHVVYFGNSDFEEIDSLSEEIFKDTSTSMFGDISNSKIVVCSYNAMPAQNHHTIIEALSKVDVNIINQCHFVFPLTYGGDSSYIQNIKDLLAKSNLKYTVLDRFLSNREIVTLRKVSDIVINIQNTDALSGSLQDHIYCGNVCIIGEWLRYIPYDNNGIYYIKTSKEDIASHFEDVILNFDMYHDRCKENSVKIKRILSWASTIENQVAVYGK